MLVIRFVVAALATLLFCSPSVALTIFLSRDLGVENLQRYCKYSNGAVYTVDQLDRCPLSIDEGLPIGGSTGFLDSEYVDGLTKVCVYDVLGQKKGVRHKAYEICPYSESF